MAQPPAELIQGEELRARALRCWEFLEAPVVHRLIEPYVVEILADDHLASALPATWRQAFEIEDVAKVAAVCMVYCAMRTDAALRPSAPADLPWGDTAIVAG